MRQQSNGVNSLILCYHQVT